MPSNAPWLSPRSPKSARRISPCACRSRNTRPRTLEDIERAHILAVLEDCKGNQTLAAEVLDIDRVTLHNKLKKYGWKRVTADAL